MHMFPSRGYYGVGKCVILISNSCFDLREFRKYEDYIYVFRKILQHRDELSNVSVFRTSTHYHLNIDNDILIWYISESEWDVEPIHIVISNTFNSYNFNYILQRRIELDILSNVLINDKYLHLKEYSFRIPITIKNMKNGEIYSISCNEHPDVIWDILAKI